jgi:hypothetical protein
MLDLDIDLVLSWREDREKFRTGLEFLAAKYNSETMFSVAQPGGDWPTPIGPTLDDLWAQLLGDIAMILEGWDLRLAMEKWAEQQSVGYTESNEPDGGSGKD